MRMRSAWGVLVVAGIAVGLVFARADAQAPARTPDQQLLFDIYKELVEINTTNSVGDNTRAAEAMARRLIAAGFPAADVQVLAPAPRKGNLVARLVGSGAKKPLLLLAHLDVVEARREDWSMDPFVLTEHDGYYYGRGTSDDKAMAAIFVTNLIRFRRDGYVPDRDLIVALTADEEGGGSNGVHWLLANHRQLIDAGLAINEGAGGALLNGRRLFNALQASEKIVQSYRVEITNKGGHSSLPVRDNAIYHLADALGRLARFDFPVNLDEVNRAYFERSADTLSGQTAEDMRAVARPTPDPAAAARLSEVAAFNARMRTTCVATRLEGGHANNALPQMARAIVNCRVLPSETEASVRETLARALADERIKMTPVGAFFASPPSPLHAEFVRAVEQVTAEMWPGVPVVPLMGTGATDSKYLRAVGIPAYGTSGIFNEVDDVRAHGRDERVLARSLYESQEYLFRLVKRLSGG